MARSRFFDRWSASYDRPALQWVTYRPIHDAVLARIGDSEPSVLVDLGCGTGQLTARLRREFPDATVVGLDLSAGMLTAATRRLAGGEGHAALARADAQNVPLAPSSVDVVVCTESFHWYPDQERVLRDVARALRPGGRLIIASIAMLTRAGDRALRRWSRGIGNPIRALPPRDLATLLERTGFEVLAQRRVPRLGPAAWPALTDARRL